MRFYLIFFLLYLSGSTLAQTEDMDSRQIISYIDDKQAAIRLVYQDGITQYQIRNVEVVYYDYKCGNYDNLQNGLVLTFTSTDDNEMKMLEAVEGLVVLAGGVKWASDNKSK